MEYNRIVVVVEYNRTVVAVAVVVENIRIVVAVVVVVVEYLEDVLFCTEEGHNSKMWRYWRYWHDKFSFANSFVQL